MYYSASFAQSLSTPHVSLVSQGYQWFECGNGSDVRLFVRVFYRPLYGDYQVKIKLPKHIDLHLTWYKCDWVFENDWLVFTIPMVDWVGATRQISMSLYHMWFEVNDSKKFNPKHW